MARTWILPLVLGGAISLLSTAFAAANCAEKAKAAAASNDGQVLSVSTVNKGGTEMCKITLLVKSSDGGPARKKTITVPK